MSKESSYPKNFRNETLSLSDAQDMLWKIGGMALGNTVSSHKALMAEELGKMFETLDRLNSEAEVIAPALPNGEVPKVSVGSLLSEIDSQYHQIFEREAQLHDGAVNPFIINDNRLPVLVDLQTFAEIAVADLHSK